MSGDVMLVLRFALMASCFFMAAVAMHDIPPWRRMVIATLYIFGSFVWVK